MRKVLLNVAVSLDGFIEGPNGEYDWCYFDQDYGMEAFFNAIDVIFMGRKSYDLINGTGDINAYPQDKYVFSDTLPLDTPYVTVIRRNDFRQKVQELKEQDGRHIWMFGGAELIQEFLEWNMIDEFLLSVHPILLGKGKYLFQQLNDRVELIHTGTENYSSGLVQLRYVLKPKFDLSQIAGLEMTV